jgi:hypothetical protein
MQRGSITIVGLDEILGVLPVASLPLNGALSKVSEETWRPIPGCHGFYSVSDRGRIRSEPIQTSRCGKQRGRILKCSPDSKGYLQFRASLRDGATKQMKVHRAVALAFLGPRPDGHQINHKSGDKLDNSVANLEYVSCRQNIRHAWELGLYDRDLRRGENSCTAKLTVDQIRQIRELSSTLGLAQLANRFGVTPENIRMIVNRTTWKHVA